MNDCSTKIMGSYGMCVGYYIIGHCAIADIAGDSYRVPFLFRPLPVGILLVNPFYKLNEVLV